MYICKYTICIYTYTVLYINTDPDPDPYIYIYVCMVTSIDIENHIDIHVDTNKDIILYRVDP